MIVSETRPASKTVATTNDGYGRLLTYTRTGDPAQTNVYNGLDDRVKATSASTAHVFTFDPDGRVLGEYGASATAVVAETIWLDPQAANDNQFGGDDGIGGYAPLAVGTGSGAGAALAWMHGNHLGVPIVYTDATGTAVTPAAYTMPGFPGQLRTLSDIYYNRYRDYDSSTGRYIQADPIGLGGGANEYVYAGGNPFRFIDPQGKEIISGLISAGFNVATQVAINYEANGRNIVQAFQCVNANSVAAAFVVGAFLPGIAPLGFRTFKYMTKFFGGATRGQVGESALGFALGAIVKKNIGDGLNSVLGHNTYDQSSCGCDGNKTGIQSAAHNFIF